MRELCGLHSKRGGPLAVRRVGGTLERIVIELERGQLFGLDSSGEGIAQELFDLLGHGSSSITNLAGSWSPAEYRTDNRHKQALL